MGHLGSRSPHWNARVASAPEPLPWSPWAAEAEPVLPPPQAGHFQKGALPRFTQSPRPKSCHPSFYSLLGTQRGGPLAKPGQTPVAPPAGPAHCHLVAPTPSNASCPHPDFPPRPFFPGHPCAPAPATLALPFQPPSPPAPPPVGTPGQCPVLWQLPDGKCHVGDHLKYCGKEEWAALEPPGPDWWPLVCLRLQAPVEKLLNSPAKYCLVILPLTACFLPQLLWVGPSC